LLLRPLVGKSTFSQSLSLDTYEPGIITGEVGAAITATLNASLASLSLNPSCK